MAYSSLFSPISIGTLTVKNRLVMPPMVRNYATETGCVTDQYVHHIERIAKGGVGMMVLEASYISPEGRGFTHELGIHSDEVIPGLKRLVRVAHKHHTAIGIQLYHAGRQTSPSTTGRKPVAPSAVADPLTNVVPHALTQKEIRVLVQQFGDAARRAKEAGCDFVEIHGAHGYLITQFLSSFSNKRTDGYGGSFEHRTRFLSEVVFAVRLAVGETFPVTVRLSADEMVPKGITIAETKRIALLLEVLGINALHISAGNYASYVKGFMIPPMAIEDGVLRAYANEVKAVVKIPVIVVAKIRTPEMAEEIIVNHQADLVAIGRPLLADPEWPNKAKEGRLHEINPCIACNQGCIGRLFAQQEVQCTVNPETGREQLFAKRPRKQQFIVVVGGGPAGLSAARTAAERGHKVLLFEQEEQLGGQLQMAGVAPYRQGWMELLQVLQRDIKRLKVQVRLGTRFTPALAKRLKPDVVVVAIGSSVTRVKISGMDRSQVVNARDVLMGQVKVEGDVVILGGGCAGTQTAEFLAVAGHRVTVVEMEKEVAREAPMDDRALHLERLNKLGVKILTQTKVLSIGEENVIVNQQGKQQTIPMHTVVICLGSTPNDGLPEELKPLVKRVIVVGDALEARRVTEAMAEGALAVVRL